MEATEVLISLNYLVVEFSWRPYNKVANLLPCNMELPLNLIIVRVVLLKLQPARVSECETKVIVAPGKGFHRGCGAFVRTLDFNQFVIVYEAIRHTHQKLIFLVNKLLCWFHLNSKNLFKFFQSIFLMFLSPSACLIVTVEIKGKNLVAKLLVFSPSPCLDDLSKPTRRYSSLPTILALRNSSIPPRSATVLLLL